MRNIWCLCAQQSARALRRPQTAVVLAARALLSTTTPAAPDKAAVAKYARQRKVYTNEVCGCLFVMRCVLCVGRIFVTQALAMQVNELRKQWAQEFQKKNEANVQQQLCVELLACVEQCFLWSVGLNQFYVCVRTGWSECTFSFAKLSG